MDLYLVVFGLTLPSVVRCVLTTGTCDYPQEYSTGVLSAEKFMVSTTVTYQCDEGYSAVFADTITYECVNASGIIKWQASEMDGEQCLKNDNTMTNNDLGKINSNNLSSNENKTVESDHCGPLPVVPNGKLDLFESKYLLGQEFNYSLHGNGDVQSGPLGVIKCMNCKGRATWVNLTYGCIQNIYGSPTPTTIWTETYYESPKIETTSWPAVYITLGVICLFLVVFLLFYGNGQCFGPSCLHH